MANHIVLTGRFGTEPEAHAGANGTRTSFRFASTEYITEYYTHWHPDRNSNSNTNSNTNSK